MIEQASLFSRLFRSTRDARVLDLADGDTIELDNKWVRLPVDGGSYRLDWGGEGLEILVDRGITAPDVVDKRDVIVFDPLRFDDRVGPFVRLSNGQGITLDSRDEELARLFPSVCKGSRRKVELSHEGNSLVFREMMPDVSSRLSHFSADQAVARFDLRRVEALERVAELFGGPLEPLSSDAAMRQLDAMHALLDDEPGRQAAADGTCGAAVKLSGELPVVIGGDLHGNVDSLLTMLSWGGLMQALEADRAVLVLLGDAVHPDGGSDLETMDPSVLMTDLAFALKLRFPANVYYLLGNHESFSPEVTKARVPQGIFWSRHLVKLRGEAYRDKLGAIYDRLPLIAYSPFFCACHAGPPHGKVPIDKLLNARQFPHLVHQLTWNRQRVPGRPEGYTKKDVRRFRKALGLPKKTTFLVGHYPRDDKGCIWLDAGGVEGHHVVYSSKTESIGVFVQHGDAMTPQVLRGEPLMPWLNQRVREAD